ncbi:MAG TPA: hypothetical protein VIJ87_21075, partial [Pyrinomonadaceae bacterium]
LNRNLIWSAILRHRCDSPAMNTMKSLSASLFSTSTARRTGRTPGAAVGTSPIEGLSESDG